MTDLFDTPQAYRFNKDTHVFKIESSPGVDINHSDLAFLVGFYLINKNILKKIDERKSPSSNKIVHRYVLKSENI